MALARSFRAPSRRISASRSLGEVSETDDVAAMLRQGGYLSALPGGLDASNTPRVGRLLPFSYTTSGSTSPVGLAFLWEDLGLHRRDWKLLPSPCEAALADDRSRKVFLVSTTRRQHEPEDRSAGLAPRDPPNSEQPEPAQGRRRRFGGADAVRQFEMHLFGPVPFGWLHAIPRVPAHRSQFLRLLHTAIGLSHDAYGLNPVPVRSLS
jgi:hypothetical protein